MSKRNVSELFNKFAGREVSVTEQQVTLGNGRTFMEARLDYNDPTVNEMTNTARDNGISIDFNYEGSRGLRTWCFGEPKNYVVAHIEKADDGKWRVTGKLDLSRDLR